MKTPIDKRSRAAPAGLTETIASTQTIRLAALPESRYFCTPIEERFERTTRLATRALRVPVAAVTLVNGSELWFKSVCGWSASKLPVAETLCKTTLEDGRLTTIVDTLADTRTCECPLVTQSPHFRAYAGVPLLDDMGLVAGTFAVFDTKPRQFSIEDEQALSDLAAITQRELLTESARSAHTQLVAKLGAARREAMIDPLTRLWNRRGTTVMLESAVGEARSSGTSLAVAMIDIDNFKNANDTHGHQAGDEVLRECVARLIRNVRVSDTLGRIGGDEFMLLLNDADEITARQVLARICSAIAASPITARQASIQTTISVGYTLLSPDEEISADELLERADRALLDAKGSGRDRVSRTE